MEAARTSETSVDNYFTRQYIPEDNSEEGYLFLPGVTADESTASRDGIYCLLQF
jgi:hypothetical protein